MTKFDILFGMPQKMGEIGMIAMWSSFYIITIICMLVDDTQGNTRDFMAASQAACCINLCTMSWAVVTGANMVKTALYTVNTDFGLTVLAWAYFEGDVFGSNAIGVFNYFHLIILLSKESGLWILKQKKPHLKQNFFRKTISPDYSYI